MPVETDLDPAMRRCRGVEGVALQIHSRRLGHHLVVEPFVKAGDGCLQRRSERPVGTEIDSGVPLSLERGVVSENALRIDEELRRLWCSVAGTESRMKSPHVARMVLN